jgi:energy-coupling factor transporter ATP-binding protein EcfA2
MLKLERLRIDKFRNVKSGSEIRFAEGFNVVLGRNGTGKTTLLDLISRIVRWKFSDLQTEEFSIAYELKIGASHLEVELDNRKVFKHLVAPFIAPELSGEQERYVPSMRATRRIDGRTHIIEFVDGQLQIDGQANDFSAGFSIWTEGQAAIAGFWGLIFSSGKVCGARFDESLDVFRSTWDERSFPGRILVSPTQQTVGAQDIPVQLLDAFVDHQRQSSGVTSFTTAHDKLVFLKKAVEGMGFASGELRIDVISRAIAKSFGGVELGNMIARFFFPDGGFITQDRLSYGQKRLLMFYYYLAANPDVVIADELVNGLHHQWITACIDEIGERQAFLTSQNPLLLDYLPFSSPEHVRKSFVLCTSELDENQKPIWSWSNMSEDASKEFYSAYEVGIEHVSEILQSQGLF